MVVEQWGSVANVETTVNDSLPVNVAFEDKVSLSGGSQVLDGGTAKECKTEAGMQNCLVNEEGRTASEGREAKTKGIILGTMNGNKDNVTITVGLDSVFNLSTFLPALVVVAAALGVIGIGSGLFAGLFSGL